MRPTTVNLARPANIALATPVDKSESLSRCRRSSTRIGGGVEGFAAGAALGALLGPPGLAAGIVLGAIIGSQAAQPNERDPEPRLLEEQLRDRLPESGSAIALIAETADVDDMLTAVGQTNGNVMRHSLSASDFGSLRASLRATPSASHGPSVVGEQTVDAATAQRTGPTT